MTIHRIAIDNTSVSIGARAIAEHLPAKTTLASGDHIELTFPAGPFVHLTGLVMLATWRKSLPEGITVSIQDTTCNQAVKNLLTNSGFREVMETGHENPSAQRRVGRLPLRSISNRFNKDATVQEVTSIFDEYAGHVTDTKPFATMLSELCENVLSHSEAVSPGYVCARVLEGQQRKVEIAICDSGIGFRGSFTKGTNIEAKQRIAKGASPIEIAIEGLNSSKPTAAAGSYVSYYGFGLFVVRRLVEENRGVIVIISSDEMIELDHYGRRHYTITPSYPGTFIGIVLDLDNPLPLEEIYEQAVESRIGPDSTPSQDNTAAASAELDTAAVESVPSISVADSKIESTAPATNDKIELMHFGTELLTREAGLAIRAELATRLLLSSHVVVGLDGITDITPSVVDEAFAKLAERLGLTQFESKVSFDGGTSLIRRLLDFVIKTRIP